jgi:hypothetical protein
MDADFLTLPMLQRICALLALTLLAAFGSMQADAAAYLPVRSTPIATAASISVNESVTAKLVSHRGGTVLNERGQGSGSFSCPLTIEINISYTHAAIVFNCPTSRGDLAGRGETSYYASGSIARFNGTLTVTHGTGSYSHATPSNLHITGSLRRGSYALQATVSGSLR